MQPHRRTPFPIIPPRVDYALTPLGTSLTEPLKGFAAWASDRRGEVAAARDAHDAADTVRT